jgi:hypothetical protein
VCVRECGRVCVRMGGGARAVGIQRTLAAAWARITMTWGPAWDGAHARYTRSNCWALAAGKHAWPTHPSSGPCMIRAWFSALLDTSAHGSVRYPLRGTHRAERGVAAARDRSSLVRFR